MANSTLLRAVGAALVSASLGLSAPLWSVDLRSLGVTGPPRLPEPKDRGLVIAVAASNEVLVSFVAYGRNRDLGTRKGPADVVRLVAFLLDGATGREVQREEWVTEAPPTPEIARLPNGGFVAVMGDHLRIFNRSLQIVRENALGLTRPDLHPGGVLTVPVKGGQFGFEYIDTKSPWIVRVIGSETLATADEWADQGDGQDWPVADIYENLLLRQRKALIEAKHEGEPWRPLPITMPFWIANPHFLNPTLFAAVSGNCWFETDGATVQGEQVCYAKPDRPGAIQSSRDGSIIAVGIGGHPSGFAAFLDLNGRGRAIVYTQGTHRKLLTTPSTREEFRFSLSLDGSLLAVQQGEKLSLYAIPHP